MRVDQDERKGLPSGSNALADSLCHGRFQAQKSMVGILESEAEPQDDSPDTDAEAGKRVHLLYAGIDCEEATQAERDRADKARVIDERVRLKWLSFFEGEPEQPVSEIREQRWWYKNADGKDVYSGQADLVRIRGEIGGSCDILVGDLKSLWGDHDSAVLNVQIRRYIALIASSIEEIGYTAVRTATAYLNQPVKTMDPQLARFSEEDIRIAKDEMIWDIDAIMAEDAPRTAGPVQCKNCTAKLLCTEYLDYISSLPVPLPIAANGPQPLEKADLKAKVLALPNEQLVRILPWLATLENTAALAKAEAKRRLKEDPACLPGWTTKKNPDRSTPTEVKPIWDRLEAEYGVSAAEFIKLCKTSKTAVEQLLRKHSGLKGEALSDKLEKILDGCCAVMKVSDSLDRVK